MDEDKNRSIGGNVFDIVGFSIAVSSRPSLSLEGRLEAYEKAFQTSLAVIFIHTLNIVIFGRRAEDPACFAQSIEFKKQMMADWILGTVPKDDENTQKQFLRTAVVDSIGYMRFTNLEGQANSLQQILEDSR